MGYGYYRLVTDLSLIGILIGVLLFVYESFTVMICMCPLGVVNCTC